MPTWGEILKEIHDEAVVLRQKPQTGLSEFDIVRRRYLQRLQKKTGRQTILYATAWTTSAIPMSPDMISITFEDLHGFMETNHSLNDNSLDLILHSPGGSPTAAEAIVLYLRGRFSDIRVIVPNMAMSAATMLACAADSVVMGKHSFLGPIDPQLILQTGLGQRAVPAQAIIAQFERAKLDSADPAKLRAWLPMLAQYGPDLLVTCQNASRLSEDLVKVWLRSYMFSGEGDAADKASTIAAWLAGHNNFLTHARPIDRSSLKEKGLKIVDLESDQEIQDLVLSIFHAANLTFSSTPVAKIIENHNGKAFLKMGGMIQSAPPGAPPQRQGPMRDPRLAAD